jgi:hypothetical protein
MDTLQRLSDFLQAPIDQFFHFQAPEPESEAQKELRSITEQLSEEDLKLLSLLALRLNK